MLSVAMKRGFSNRRNMRSEGKRINVHRRGLREPMKDFRCDESRVKLCVRDVRYLWKVSRCTAAAYAATVMQLLEASLLRGIIFVFVRTHILFDVGRALNREKHSSVGLVCKTDRFYAAFLEESYRWGMTNFLAVITTANTARSEGLLARQDDSRRKLFHWTLRFFATPEGMRDGNSIRHELFVEHFSDCWRRDSTHRWSWSFLRWRCNRLSSLNRAWPYSLLDTSNKAAHNSILLGERSMGRKSFRFLSMNNNCRLPLRRC